MKLNKESVIEFVLYAVLVLSFFIAGYSLYLDVIKRNISGGEAAFIVGLTTAASFAVGLLYMYVDKKMSLITVEVYSELLAKEFNKINHDLDKCTKECLCAADAYIRLLFVRTYIDTIRRSVSSV
jgi:hypothetical protein